MQLRLTRARGTAAAALAGLAAAAFTLAAPAQPAHAWPWDSTVTATGKLTGCSTAGPLQMASVRANLNGQVATWSSPLYSSPPTYSLTWHNVPSGGGYAFVVVHCSAVTPDYSTWIHVYRPGWGEGISGGNI